MSGAVKQRTAAPSSSDTKTKYLPASEAQDRSGTKKTTNGSATLSYPSETRDDVNMNEVDGLVHLDVILPNGQHLDVTVDYNTPMMDLLVCLAGKSKLSPSGLLMQLLEEDTMTALNYKPNQIIGSLGGRQVRLLDKKALEEQNKNKIKSSKRSFEMTHRFTVNLPRGQKTVLRVSPAMSVAELMATVCRDKELDPRRHYLQLPGKPGVPVDLGHTLGQLGVFEINLINVSSMQEHNITNSMPDLSQVPTYMPTSGELKKKRGFLSFLSKKDRKFKPQDALYSIETSSTASHTAHNRKSQSPPPTSHRRVSDTGFESSRPKSMFVSSNANSSELSLAHKENMPSQENIAPIRKKRRAPAPPTPSSADHLSSSKQDINANENTDLSSKSHNGVNDEVSHNAPSVQKQTASSVNKSQSAPSRAEMLSRLHSRNSSDSSGYHELTLSGCESPEAGHNIASKSKTSIDSTSIESSDINNGADSGIHESPVRVSPIEEVLETASPHLAASKDKHAIKSTTLPISSKKKKAPAPPAPSPSPPAQAPAPSVQPSTQPPVTELSSSDMSVQAAQYQSVQNEAIEVSVSSDEALPNHQINSEVYSPPASFDDSSATQTVPSTILHMNEDPDLSDEDINAAFDIDDILEGVTFVDEPKKLEIKTFSMMSNTMGQDDGAMMMMETSSIASENIDQLDTLSKSERPCAFIPPPPPTEPPPPEVEAVHIGSLNASSGPILIDKETEVNDDNTSLAPASMKNSPEPVSQDGYKNEMALFVERMSKMAVDNQDQDGNALNDSLSSGLSISETNSETGSVIQHLRTDSSDSKSGLDTGSWSRKDTSKINNIKEDDETDETCELKVSEEITVPIETLPPPPEFGDHEDKKEEYIEDEEEEEFTETIEELIIPLGPNGFDFSAARKIPDLETSKEHTQSVKDFEEVPAKNGVFRAEPVSITPLSPKPKEEPKKTEVKKEEVQEKEEFILTTDDLSNVCFLPPRPKSVKRTSEQNKESPRISAVSSAVLILDKSKNRSQEEEASTESIQNRVSQLSFTPRSEPETDSVLEVKPISLLNRPSMRAHVAEDYTSEEDVPMTSSPRLQSDSDFSDNAENISSFDNGPTLPDKEIEEKLDSVLDSPRKESMDASDRSGSRAAGQGIDSQYDMLQTQFAQWQEQLAHNQNILSQATANDLQAEQLQQLTTQMNMQQNMMLQIQATMQALQQQQLVNGGNGDKAASVEFPSVEVEQAAAAAEPPQPPPAPAAPPAPPPLPEPAVPAASGTKTDNSKPSQSKSKSRPKPKFERELDPREQLMIAIRTFQGREGLKSVSKKDTKWIHSNR